MVDQQTQALLSYNAGNPDMVRRIVQERGLSQEQVAQAMNLSPEAAARYGGGMNPDQGMEETTIEPPVKPGQGPRQIIGQPGMRQQEPSGADIMRGGTPNAGIQPVGGTPSLQPVGGAPAIGGTTGGTGVGPAGLGTAGLTPMPIPTVGAPTGMPQKPTPINKPGALPADLRPTRPFGGGGIAQARPIRGRMGGGLRGIGDQAFELGFNRARGIRQQ